MHKAEPIKMNTKYNTFTYIHSFFTYRWWFCCTLLTWHNLQWFKSTFRWRLSGWIRKKCNAWCNLSILETLKH